MTQTNKAKEISLEVFNKYSEAVYKLYKNLYEENQDLKEKLNKAIEWLKCPHHPGQVCNCRKRIKELKE